MHSIITRCHIFLPTDFWLAIILCCYSPHMFTYTCILRVRKIYIHMHFTCDSAGGVPRTVSLGWLRGGVAAVSAVRCGALAAGGGVISPAVSGRDWLWPAGGCRRGLVEMAGRTGSGELAWPARSWGSVHQTIHTRLRCTCSLM